MAYLPQNNTFVQSQYFDQQATALAGMLANASDINLVDSAFVGAVSPTQGLTAGIGVQVLPTTASNRPGVNYDKVIPPLATATDADFAGIVVRNQFMRTNSAGEACWYFEDMANYARRQRSGCRIWVQLESGTATFGGKVYWIVRDTAGTNKRIGAFAAAPIAGTATPTPSTLKSGTLNLNAIKSIQSGGFDITVDSTLKQLSGMDFSGVTTLSAVAVILQQAFTAQTVAVSVTVEGNTLVIKTDATGASAPTLTFASAPTAAGAVNASAALGLTAASGGMLVQGTAGEASDTVELTSARFCGTFTAGALPCNNIALVELLG